jgi:two-component system, OmpR family, sensor kinase
MSLRRRLALALLATVALALVIVAIATYAVVSRSQLDLVDEDLERAHPRIEEAASGTPLDLTAIREAGPGLYVELRDPTGATVGVVPVRTGDDGLVDLVGLDVPTPPPPPVGGPADDDEFATDGDDGPRYATIGIAHDLGMRVRTTRGADGSLLIIGRLLEELERTRHLLLAVLGGAGLVAVLVTLGLGTWLLRAALRPLDAVERAAADISDDDLGRRVPGDDRGTEVGRLAATINRMLERLEDAFAQRERDLATVQESERRMRRFVADASHELRTPLAATAAYAELFERGARDRPDDLARAMAGIRSETGRMAGLIDDLLLLARLDEGRPLERGTVDLARLVADAVDAASTVDPDHPISTRFDGPIEVRGDPGRLRQLVDNLLANVRTHTPPGTPCDVRVTSEGGRVILVVEDRGSGMAEEDAALAFERFHRADSSRSRSTGGGSGLGLSIVAAIADAHGGTARLTSIPGAGTTVRIELPPVDPDE